MRSCSYYEVFKIECNRFLGLPVDNSECLTDYLIYAIIIMSIDKLDVIDNTSRSVTLTTRYSDNETINLSVSILRVNKNNKAIESFARSVVLFYHASILNTILDTVKVTTDMGISD